MSLCNTLSVFAVLAVLVSVLVLTTGQQAPTPAQLENIANLAEKMSDRQQQKYCERFGAKFAEKSEVWPTVMEQCINKLVFERQAAKLPANFPTVSAEIDKKVIEIHGKCAQLVSNPCIQEDWQKVKKCIRDEGMAINVLNVGQPGGAVPKNMASISLGLASSIFDCTEKTLQ